MIKKLLKLLKYEGKINPYLKDTLDDIEHYLKKNIVYPNRGGCGIIAYHISKELSKRNIKHSIAIKWMSKYDNDTFSASHIWIKINNHHFNDCGNKNNDYYKLYNPNKLRLLESISYENRANWNDEYNRVQTKKLKETIKRKFNKFDKIKHGKKS